MTIAAKQKPEQRDQRVHPEAQPLTERSVSSYI